MEEGISLFSTLLNNKHFLIVFVHALEQQKDFAVRDRYKLQNQRLVWDCVFQWMVESHLPTHFC